MEIRTAVLPVLLVLAGPVAAISAAEEKVLNVYNWADYIGPTTIEDFEAEFGIEVNYDLYDATANLASLPLLDPSLRNDPAAYPPMEDRLNWRAGHIYDPKLERRRTRAWLRVKTGL